MSPFALLSGMLCGTVGVIGASESVEEAVSDADRTERSISVTSF